MLFRSEARWCKIRNYTHLSTDMQNNWSIWRRPEVVNHKVPLAPCSVVGHVEMVEQLLAKPVNRLCVVNSHRGLRGRRGACPVQKSVHSRQFAFTSLIRTSARGRLGRAVRHNPPEAVQAISFSKSFNLCNSKGLAQGAARGR